MREASYNQLLARVDELQLITDELREEINGLRQPIVIDPLDEFLASVATMEISPPVVIQSAIAPTNLYAKALIAARYPTLRFGVGEISVYRFIKIAHATYGHNVLPRATAERNRLLVLYCDEISSVYVIQFTRRKIIGISEVV